MNIAQTQAIVQNQPLIGGRGASIQTSFSDSTSLTNVAFEGFVLDSLGTVTLSVLDVAGNTIALTANDLNSDALKGRIPFVFTRINSTGTTATRVLCVH